MPDTRNSYDEVPYPSFAYTQTHPGHLGVLAVLSDVTPPPVATARILELGCGEGGNLLPLAATLPQARCVGVELSGRAVEVAQTSAAELGLSNVEILHADLSDLGPDLGRFDYIIAYGVYSWVPDPVRDRLMDLIRDCLAPQGVAYLSYNVFPGWRQFGTVRDAMMFHGRTATTPQERVQRGREVLEQLAEAVPDRESAYRQVFRHARDLLAPLSDGYVIHDFLEDVNEPLYFRQFIAHAAAHGLQFLANAEQAGPEMVSAELTRELGALAGDIIELEQYRDFLTNRSFRETALCHADTPVQRVLDVGRLASLQVGSRAEPQEPIRLDSFDRVELATPSGASLSTAHPLTKAALHVLATVSPRVLPLAELIQRARDLLASLTGGRAASAASRQDELVMVENLLLAYSQNIDLVQLHAWAPPVLAVEVTSRPEVLGTARWQAGRDVPVTNVFHQRVNMDDLARGLVALVDGTRTLEELATGVDLEPAEVRRQLDLLAGVGLLVR